jgi:hypothetical protein
MPVFTPTGAEEPPASFDFVAMWDTGATNTVISDSVVRRCSLTPTGVIRVRSVDHSALAEMYDVNVVLPNLVHVPNLVVTRGDFSDIDVIVGMDIIGLGDFAVTNFGGVTKFSFRVPSQRHIDFVEHADGP